MVGGDILKYDKPHLTLALQVDHLRQRGLVVTDTDRAISTLNRVGYYRFSAYAYPFRERLPADSLRDSSVQYRSDRFVRDVPFELIESLWSFDRRLRLLMLDALETIEIGLRVQLSYVLGARDPFGYLHPESLDSGACEQIGPDGNTVWVALAHGLSQVST